MCNYQRSYTCGSAQKANACGAKSSTKWPNNSRYVPKTCTDNGTSTAASSEDGDSVATADTVTSPTSEKNSFPNGLPSRGYSGCGGGR